MLNVKVPKYVILQEISVDMMGAYPEQLGFFERLKLLDDAAGRTCIPRCKIVRLKFRYVPLIK